jgi:hypothetical protein
MAPDPNLTLWNYPKPKNSLVRCPSVLTDVVAHIHIYSILAGAKLA